MPNGNGRNGTNPWNPWAAIEDMAAESGQYADQLRYSADGQRPVVPHADGFPHIEIPANGRLPVPAGIAPGTPEMAMDAMLAELRGIRQGIETLIRYNDLQVRMAWIRFVADASLSPTGAELPISGSSGVAYTAGTYVPFYTNRREYPVGIYVTAQWVTPGARLKLSLNTGDNGLVAELQNGGPSGGTITKAITLNPGQTIFAANFDPLVPFNANDLFRILILDIANNIKRDVFRTVPWGVP